MTRERRAVIGFLTAWGVLVLACVAMSWLLEVLGAFFLMLCPIVFRLLWELNRDAEQTRRTRR
jgi:hypothetical protein